METTAIDNAINLSQEGFDLRDENAFVIKQIDQSETLFQLGAWLSGIDCFIAAGSQTFADRRAITQKLDYLKELKIVRTALQKCSHFIFLLLNDAAHNGLSYIGSHTQDVSVNEVKMISIALRESLVQCESLNRLSSLGLGEWRAWGDAMLDRFGAFPVYARVMALTDSGTDADLPASITGFSALAIGDGRSEIFNIMIRFGRILRVLYIVGKMLKSDEPLKPAILIFSKINAQTLELIGYLNHRVERMASSDEEVAGSLDGASYTAAIELKKVVQQELAGLINQRPATGVFARTETAYAVLTEAFQHILTGLARQLDPAADMFEMFPTFAEKRDRSIILRRELHVIADLTRIAEMDAEKDNTEKLNAALTDFLEATVGYLFYKDIETVERFVEEILVTRQKKDLVPILHRFGAYLETLFAQVKMRSVLEKYPF